MKNTSRYRDPIDAGKVPTSLSPRGSENVSKKLGIDLLVGGQVDVLQIRHAFPGIGQRAAELVGTQL